jgi:hypothetical protein
MKFKGYNVPFPVPVCLILFGKPKTYPVKTSKEFEEKYSYEQIWNPRLVHVKESNGKLSCSASRLQTVTIYPSTKKNKPTGFARVAMKHRCTFGERSPKQKLISKPSKLSLKKKSLKRKNL